VIGHLPNGSKLIYVASPAIGKGHASHLATRLQFLPGSTYEETRMWQWVSLQCAIFISAGPVSSHIADSRDFPPLRCTCETGWSWARGHRGWSVAPSDTARWALPIEGPKAFPSL